MAAHHSGNCILCTVQMCIRDSEWAAIGSILNLTILWDAGTDCLPILQPKQAEAQNSMTLHIVWKIYDLSLIHI